MDLPSSLQVVTGAVFHIDNLRLYDGSTKGKFVVVGVESEPLVLYVINTTPSPWARKQRHVMDCQVKLAASYGFLKTESHLDCHYYYQHEDVSTKKLTGWLKSGSAQYKTRLKDSDLKKMRDAVSRSKAIENDLKQATLDALAGCLDS